MVMVGRGGTQLDTPRLLLAWSWERVKALGMGSGKPGMWVVLHPGSTHWTHLCRPPHEGSRNPAGMTLAKSSSVWRCLGRKGRKEEKVTEVGLGHLGNPLECRCRSVLNSSSASHPPWPCQGRRWLIPQIPEHPQLPTRGTQRSLPTTEQRICCKIPKLWVKKRIKKDPNLPTGAQGEHHGGE